MTIKKVLNNLHKDDARRFFWTTLQEKINKGEYQHVFEMAEGLVSDDDYRESIQVILTEVRSRLFKLDGR